MRQLILRSFQSPGDLVMLTAAVRDLHAAVPGRFQTDVRTSAAALWENNPHVTPLREGGPGVEVLDMHYPLIHQSNERPYHFLHGYPQYLEQQLGLRIPVTRFHGDIHLSATEMQAPPAVAELPERFWIIVAGGKYDFTAKWWDPSRYQRVVDHFDGRLTFAQCGEAGHWHPALRGVVNLVGKTSLRDFVRLMYHAEGVVCGVTFAMHLAAAVPVRPGRRKQRPCVVVAGGREPPHWEAYPHHQFLSTVGTLPCCADGGCWKSRCQRVGDGDDKDRHDLCSHPVDLTPQLRIPRCLDLIRADDVIRRIELYLEEAALFEPVARPTVPTAPPVVVPPAPRCTAPLVRKVLLESANGLDDAVQLTIVLKHLRHYHPEWTVDVATTSGKHTAFTRLCRRTLVLDGEPVDRADYDQIVTLDWHEGLGSNAAAEGTKSTRCLRETFGLSPVAELCSYTIHYEEDARKRARDYLQSVCPTGPGRDGRYPVVVLSCTGELAAEGQGLSPDLVRAVSDTVRAAGFVAVCLEEDDRSPFDDSRVHHLGARHALWGESGSGDAGLLAALLDAVTLFVGVEGGPLYVAGATNTSAVAVWTRSHPLDAYDLARNVLHLVPDDHDKLVRGTDRLDSFRRFYRHRLYQRLHVDLSALVESILTRENVEELVRRR